MIAAALILALAPAEMRPMPRPIEPQGTVLVVDCGEAIDAVPALVLGDDDSGPPRFAVTLDEAGRWQLVALLSNGTACLMGGGTFFGLSPAMVPQPKGEPA